MKRNSFLCDKYGKTPQQNIGDRLRKSINIFRSRPARRVLDIGCGDGGIAMLIKEATDAEEVYGVDISEEGVRLAKERGLKAYQLDLDSENLPFGDDYFDAIFCGEVIEHLYDTDHLLQEIGRTLKMGGVCVLTTPNLASWYNRLVLLLAFQPYSTGVSLRHNVGKLWRFLEGANGHIRMFTYRALKELLRKNGLKIAKAHGCSQAELLPFPLNFVDSIISRITPLAATILIALTKEAE